MVLFVPIMDANGYFPQHLSEYPFLCSTEKKHKHILMLKIIVEDTLESNVLQT